MESGEVVWLGALQLEVEYEESDNAKYNEILHANGEKVVEKLELYYPEFYNKDYLGQVLYFRKNRNSSYLYNQDLYEGKMDIFYYWTIINYPDSNKKHTVSRSEIDAQANGFFDPVLKP